MAVQKYTDTESTSGKARVVHNGRTQKYAISVGAAVFATTLGRGFGQTAVAEAPASTSLDADEARDLYNALHAIFGPQLAD